MLQLLLLQLDLLARRSNVHQSPPDLGDLIEHLLIGQIKHLVRLLGGIERLVGLGLHYRVGPLEKAHAGLLLADDGPAAPIPPPGRLRIDAGADTGTDTPRLPPRPPRRSGTHLATECHGPSIQTIRRAAVLWAVTRPCGGRSGGCRTGRSDHRVGGASR
jgi:hypothetical protein